MIRHIDVTDDRLTHTEARVQFGRLNRHWDCTDQVDCIKLEEQVTPSNPPAAVEPVPW